MMKSQAQKIDPGVIQSPEEVRISIYVFRKDTRKR